MFSLDTFVLLQKAIAYAAMALLVAAAFSDIRTLRIPNILILAIGSLGIVRLALLGSPIAGIYAAGMVALIFAIGILLFSRDLIGGGDVKLLMATILLIRYRDWYEFFVFMAVFGGLLSLVVVVLRSYLPLAFGARLAAHMQAVRLSVPYGVAIAGAGVVTLLLQPILFRYSFPFPPSFLW